MCEPTNDTHICLCEDHSNEFRVLIKNCKGCDTILERKIISLITGQIDLNKKYKNSYQNHCYNCIKYKITHGDLRNLTFGQVGEILLPIIISQEEELTMLKERIKELEYHIFF